MNKHLVSYAWFLGFLLLTKIVVAPVLDKIGPKDATGKPLIDL